MRMQSARGRSTGVFFVGEEIAYCREGDDDWGRSHASAARANGTQFTGSASFSGVSPKSAPQAFT
jgi:hypothetical protein